MAIDLFETRTMLQMLEEMKPARTFLKERFFSNMRTFDTEYVDIDIIKGKRRMAPFVSPVIGGKTVERLGYKTETYKPVLVAPDMITTAEDLLKRAPGSNLYERQSPEERAAEQMGRDMAELDEMITRREEWMVAQALFTGSIRMTGEGVDQSVNFGLTNTEILEGTSIWSDKSNSDPLKDLRGWRREILKSSGVNPDTLILGSDVVDAFLGHPIVKEDLSTRRVDLGVIDPTQMPGGVTYLGYLKDVGLDLFSYDEWYLDDNGVEQPMVPTNKVLIGSTQARTDMLYGAVLDVEIGAIDLPRVPRTWVQKKPSARFLQLSSRPLPVPVQIDAFFVATVLP
ncbi:major capsid protein [Acetomicrobium sp. S15 = DSM 107314]|uniref:major capsid protein n=1 Tax=Acetomicrobium sp. S15 = DSM 107314 TaxID=2529858 RepID=UPI0018E112A3|nr:major capsid protein [Acetomicrobium sp. S15 = DSM 107314]